jgi:hypothetical protein
MGRKLVASLLAAMLLMTMSVAAVGAAPVNNPQAEFFTVECSNGETYDVVVAQGNVAHVLGTNQRIIPQHFTFQLVVDGKVVFKDEEGVGKGKKRGLQNRLVTCTAQVTIPEEEIPFIEEELGIDLTGTDAFFRIIVQAMITPGGPRR